MHNFVTTNLDGTAPLTAMNITGSNVVVAGSLTALTLTGSNVTVPGSLTANTYVTATGPRQYYQSNVSSYVFGEGIVGGWNNVTSTSFDINTSFPLVFSSGTVTTGVELHVTSGTGSASVSAIINLTRPNAAAAWSMSTMNQVHPDFVRQFSPHK